MEQAQRNRLPVPVVLFSVHYHTVADRSGVRGIPTLGGLLLKLNRGTDVGLRLSRLFAAVLPSTANLVRPLVRGRNSPVR